MNYISVKQMYIFLAVDICDPLTRVKDHSAFGPDALGLG